METKIDFLGIVRNTSRLNSPLGSCQEMINLRKKYGTWRPILPKTAVQKNFPPSNEMFIHTMDEFEYYIAYITDGTVKAYTSAGVFVELLTTLDTGLDIKFNAIGDFLLINDRTNYAKYIFRCTPTDTPKYEDVSNIPYIHLTIESEETDNIKNYVAKYNNESFQEGWVLNEKDMRELYPEYFEGYVFLRWAIELIDGTTLKHSAPVFLYNGNVTLTDHTTWVTIHPHLCKLKYTIQDALPDGWDHYDNLIRGVSIFMTKPESRFDLDLSGLTEEDVFLGLIEKPNLLVDLFRDQSAYFRIHHIPYNKIIASETGYIGASKPIGSSHRGGTGAAAASWSRINRRGGTTPADPHAVSSTMTNIGVLSRTGDVVPLYNPAEFNINNIFSYEMLNVDDVSHHTIVGIRTLNYNSRLFYGDVYTSLFNGYNIEKLITPSGGALGTFDLHVEVDLATQFGMRTVRQTMDCSKDTINFPYLIGYPDIRATEMRILHNSGGSTIYVLTIALESHPLLNMATANKIDGADIEVQAKDTAGIFSIAIADIVTVGALATLNTNLRDKNRVQLTELYNPFVTPAINSYQVGEGNILKMAVNMLPLEDRFGTFPVFVFSTRGIWTLNLSDTGSVIISNIVPVSSSVCINSDSVIIVDNLLVFLASDGIKLLTGQTPAEISDIAEGSNISALAGDSSYGEIMVQDLMNGVSDQISAVDILTYAAGTLVNGVYINQAKFGYDKNHREIIVSNSEYDYSYIYSLDEKVWYKCSQVFKKFITNYPNLYAFLSTGNDLVDISEEDSSGDVPVYFETRPMLIGPDKEVKIARLTLGGQFNVADAKYAGLMLYGSNDGATWSLITGKEIEGASIYNIILSRLPLSLRYILLVFSGTVDEASTVSELRILT